MYIYDQVKRFPNWKNKTTPLKIYLHLPVVLEGLFTECKGLFTQKRKRKRKRKRSKNKQTYQNINDKHKKKLRLCFRFRSVCMDLKRVDITTLFIQLLEDVAFFKIYFLTLLLGEEGNNVFY